MAQSSSSPRLQRDPDITFRRALPPPPPPQPIRKHRPFWRELPVLVVVAFAVALLLKAFVVQAFFIPSESMEDTLVEGDRVLVEKISYRFGGPERGQVVVFEKDLAKGVQPAEEDISIPQRIGDSFRELFGFPTGTSQDYIKRVIAIEGDTIRGRDGKVYVNDELIEEPYVAEGAETYDFGPVTVPEDSIFVMGDNRDHSGDSRVFGPVSVDTVVGRAFLLIWPPSDFSTL